MTDEKTRAKLDEMMGLPPSKSLKEMNNKEKIAAIQKQFEAGTPLHFCDGVTFKARMRLMNIAKMQKKKGL